MRKPSGKSLQRRHRVELEFLEALRARLPKHAPTLEALGHLYTRVGKYEEGLGVDLDITQLKPDEPEAWYNLACSLSMVGRKDDAFVALEKAIDLGYSDFEWMARDPDLKPLQGDPRLARLGMRISN